MSAPTLPVYPYAGLRPGVDLASPAAYHIVGPRIRTTKWGDWGTGLCGAPVWICGQWWVEDYPMCPACREIWERPATHGRLL